MPEVYVSPPAPIKGVRTTQPQTPVRLTNIFAVDFATVPSFPPGTFSGGTVLGINRVGRSYSFPTLGSTTSWVSFGNSAQDIFWLSPGWALFVLIPTASGSYYIANKSDNNGQQGWSLYESGSGAFEMKYIQSGNTTVSSVAGALTLNAVNVVLVNFNGNPYLSGTTKLYVNGLDVTGLYSSVGTTGHDSDAPQPLRLGYGAFGASNSFVGSINLAAFGRKWLSDAEIRSLSANPWQLFMPAQGRVFVPQVSDQTPSIAPKQPTTPRQTQMMGTAGVGVASVAPVANSLARRVRKSQPQYQVGIDWSNPITRGLTGAWNFATSALPACAVSGVSCSVVSGAVKSANALSKRGMISSTGGHTDGLVTANRTPAQLNVDGDKPKTMLCFGAHNSTATERACLFSLGSQFTADYGWAVKKFDSAVYYTCSAWGADRGLYVTGINDGDPITIVVRKDAGVVGEVIANGISYGSVGSSVAAFDPAGKVGFGYESNDQYPWNRAIFVGAVWSRKLSDAEVASVTSNPWQIFAPDNKKIWVPT